MKAKEEEATVLEALKGLGGSAGMGALARRTGLVASRLYRILGRLEGEGSIVSTGRGHGAQYNLVPSFLTPLIRNRPLPDEVLIRRAAKQDVEVLRSLTASAQDALGALLGERGGIGARRPSKSNVLLVAECGNGLSGYVVVMCREDGSVYWSFAVTEKYRGSGLLEWLLAASWGHLPERGKDVRVMLESAGAWTAVVSDLGVRQGHVVINLENGTSHEGAI